MGEVYVAGRVVGRVADGVFRRRLKDGQVLRKPAAVAMHVEVLDQLRRLDCRTVVFDMPDGTTLTGPLSLYEDHGFDVNRGAGRQRAVRVESFAVMTEPVIVTAAGLDW